MKPPPFDYLRAHSIEEVCAELSDSGEDALVLAGGQSLMPLLALRLARPSVLIDVNEIPTLKGTSCTDDVLTIRAGTRQAEALCSNDVRLCAPLLAKAIAWVGHGQTRNRGTVGGSLAMADPAAEIPLAAMTLDASMLVRRGDKHLEHRAAEFLLDSMITALEQRDLLVEVQFPIWAQHAVGTSFKEVAARKGDFALVSAAVQIALDIHGRCTQAAFGAGNAGPAPIRLTRLETALIGQHLTSEVIAEAVELVDPDIDPPSDSRASAGYRRRVLKRLLTQAISEANDEALDPN